MADPFYGREFQIVSLNLHAAISVLSTLVSILSERDCGVFQTGLNYGVMIAHALRRRWSPAEFCSSFWRVFLKSDASLPFVVDMRLTGIGGGVRVVVTERTVCRACGFRGWAGDVKCTGTRCSNCNGSTMIALRVLYELREGLSHRYSSINLSENLPATPVARL